MHGENCTSTPNPRPFLIKVHCGAGSGKYTIRKCFSEKEPISFDDSVDRLYVIRTIFTVVDGLTMHSAFKINFVNTIITWRTQTSQQAIDKKPL